MHTVMILNFRIDRLGKTDPDQSAPRSGSALFASFGCITLWVEPLCSSFRINKAVFQVSEILWILR